MNFIKHILLLPGHGGSDSGALTQDKKYKESDATYSVALMTKQLLEYNNFKCTLSRTSDQMCGNASNVNDDVNNQIKMANSGQYDLAIAIHFNAFNNQAKGTEVIYNDMIYNRAETIKLGNFLLNELIETTKLVNRGLKNVDHVGVIKRVKIPVVLSECCFIDNPNEQIWAIDELYQYELAKAHCKAVCKYFGIEYKEDHQKEVDNLIEEWKLKMGIEATNVLSNKGLLNNPEQYKDKMDEKVEMWLFFEMIKRLAEKVS